MRRRTLKKPNKLPKGAPLVFVAVHHGPYRGVARREIERRATAMLAALQLEEAEISIVLTNDEEIHQLNREYRRKDKPTDVLAFAFREGHFTGSSEPAKNMLGDVVVSVPTAARQARERSIPLLAEVTMLLAHGILHLLGWDHQTDETDRKMRRKTNWLIRVATA